MSDELKQAVLTFEGMDISKGKKKDGSEWTRYSFKDSQGLKYSTFSETFAKDLQETMGIQKLISWVEQEGEYQGQPVTYRNIANVGEVEEIEPELTESQNEWDKATDSGEHDRPTGSGKKDPDRSFALSYAKDIVVALIEAKVVKGVDDALAATEILSVPFGVYLAGGEFPPTGPNPDDAGF